MSLVNDMLRDLDDRREKNAREDLNLDWMSGQKNSQKSRWILPVGGTLVLLILLVIAYGVWRTQENGGLAAVDQVVSHSPDNAASLEKQHVAQQASLQPETSEEVSNEVALTDAVQAGVVNQPLSDSSPELESLNVVDTSDDVSTPVETKMPALEVAKREQKPEQPTLDSAQSEHESPVKTVQQKEAAPVVRSLSAGQQDIDTARQVKRLLRAKRYQQAETRLLEFMEEHPTAVNSGELLSSLWLSQHRMEEVRVLLEELRASHPHHIGLLTLHARLYMAEKNPEMTVSLLMSEQPAVTRHPAYYELLGLAARQNGQYDLSRQVYQELVAIDDRRGDWWVGLAISLELGGDGSNARGAYRRGLSASNTEAAVREYARQRLEVL